jgi:hypothetical protein
MSKKILGRSALIFFFTTGKTGNGIDKLVNIRVSTYIHICYMLFNQQQCFIYSTASFLPKLRAKKVEKLRILVIKQLQQMTAYRKFRK